MGLMKLLYTRRHQSARTPEVKDWEWVRKLLIGSRAGSPPDSRAVSDASSKEPSIPIESTEKDSRSSPTADSIFESRRVLSCE